MVISDGLAIIAGKMLGAKLPEKAIKIGASAIFFLFGMFSMFEGGAKFPLHIWGIAVVIVAVVGFVFLRNSGDTEVG
jgi:uncharacterized membrane protein